MDRSTALRVLGLPPHASSRRIRAAHAHLREHLLERAFAAASVAEKAERLAEIQALENALAADLWPGAGARRARLSAAGAAVAAVAVLLGWTLWGRPVAVPAPEETAPAPAEPVARQEAPEPPPPEPAEIAVRAAVDGASFRILAAGSGEGAEPLAVGPADGTVVSVPIPVPSTPEPASPPAGPPTGPGSPAPLVLQVTHPDCAGGFRREIELEPGERSEFDAQPCPNTGWLVVRSNVTGDQLRVEGRALGATGPEAHPLKIGDYALRVEKAGYAAWSDFVRIAPGEVLERHARLARQAAPEIASTAAARSPGANGMTSERGGTHSWFQSVSHWMVDHYDSDKSGLIDSATEVAAIPCETWQALEMSYETGGLGAPMSRLYGFDGSRWVPEALGFDVRVRDQAYDRMRACGLR